ncbi:MAG TPA: hypothetical protein VGD40_22100 [Chryseosolibacter sp.]
MIRILFDEQGDSHSDIFFKIDVAPSFLQVADLYFVGDFLGNEEKRESKEDLMIAFIDYIQATVLSVAKEETFIPIDLSDEYVGGLLVSRKNGELLKVKYVWTDKFRGFEITRAHVEKMVKDQKAEFRVEGEWLISMEGAINGLTWSREKIKRTT